MACNVKNKRQGAIYNTVRAILKADELGLNNLGDVIGWFGENYPDISSDEIIQSIVLPTKKNISDSQKAYQQKISNVRKEAKLTDRLDKLLSGITERPPERKKSLPSTSEMKELSNIHAELLQLSEQPETDVSMEDFAEILARVNTIRKLYQHHYEAGGEVSVDAIQRALTHAREIKRQLKIDQLDSRIAELQEKLQMLSDPNNIDVEAIIKTEVVKKPIDTEIQRKQIEIQELKNAVDSNIDEAKGRMIAKEGVNLAGFRFTGEAAQRARYLWYMAGQYGWEVPRTMSFMMDASAFGVQVAPIVMYDVVGDVAFSPARLIQKYILGDNHIKVFPGMERTRDVLRDGFWNIMLQDYRHGGATSRRSGSVWARQKYEEVLRHPLYTLMDQAGLKLSQSKSLTNSEEFFRTQLVNKVPVAGWIKDISEDTMVTTLNMYRVSLFEQFYNMNPGLSPKEYARVAEVINNLTGTTNSFPVILNGMSYFFSAPRLLVAKVKLFWKLFGVTQANRMDIPKSFSEGKLRFKSPADAFIFNQTMGVGLAYGAFFGMVALASQIFDSVDLGDDPEESDFLRVRVGPVSMDFTGGLGTLYRTMAQMHYITFGPPEDASFLAKKRLNDRKNIQRKDAMDILLTNMVRYKAMPTINGIYSVFRGKNFFGEPYDFFEEFTGTPRTDGFAPKLEAMMWAMTPIFMQTTYEQYVENERTGFLADNAVGALQFFGVNTFEYGNISHNVKVQDYINAIEYQPQRDYPDRLGQKKEGNMKEWLKNKYADMEGDALGGLILSYDADPEKLSANRLKAQWKRVKAKTHADFMSKYGEFVNELENDPDKMKKKKKKTTTSSGRPQRPTRPKRPTRPQPQRIN